MGDTYPKFKAAVAQVSPVFLDREATIEKACKLMAEASKNGAKLIAFPETYIPGYPHWIWLDAPLANSHFFKKLFEESVIIPGPATEELCIGAKEADIYVVVGVNEKLSTQMGTMWNANLIIDNNGKLLGKHRKIVPTFGEKMVWASGDGSGLRVWETDIGRIGTLICGNNSHCLYKYALIAQGEQVHITNYPNQPDSLLWNRIRSGANSLEGKVFTLCSTGAMNSEMIDMLCGNDEKKRSWVEAGHSYSSITHPSGETLVEILDKEEIIYAGIDISEIITAKQFHDITGHYTRMDVVSLNLCQDEDRPLWFSTRMRAEAPSETMGLNLSNQLMEIKQDYENIREESKRMLEVVSHRMTELKKTSKT
jgi:nitrilase